ncbi:hypothetical protein LXJ58_34530, partial [Escherichia coli]|nr:hypothetical protein [Escherichia coli]
IEQKLALDTAPITWPIGRGKSFAGTYNLQDNTVRRRDEEEKPTPVNGPEAAGASGLLPENERQAWIDEVTLARDA